MFASVGLKPALRKIASKNERRAVMQSAWSKFSKVNVPAHVGFTASWLILRTMLRNIHLDRSTKNLLVAKDVLIAGALITGVAATITGKALKRASQKGASQKKNVGIGTTTPAKPTKVEKPAAKKAGKSSRYNRLMRLEKKLGRANMAFLAGAIIISPAIGMGILRSQRMGLLARLINR